MAQTALSRAERTFVLDGLSVTPVQRLDNRSLHEFRAIEVDTSTTEHADGSARVSLGGTEILCGIKAEMETYEAPRVTVHDGKELYEFAPWLPPRPRVQVSVESSPALLHEHNATELSMMTSTVEDMLSACFGRNGNAFGPLDARQFIVVPYAKFWLIHVDVYVMSWSGGNVLDAIFAAVYVAFGNTRIPATKLLDATRSKEQESEPTDDDDPAGMKFITRGKKPAPSTGAMDFALESEWGNGRLLDGREEVPVCISVYPVRDSFLLDPTLEEEASLMSCVAVLGSASGRLYGVRQTGSGDISVEIIHKAMDVGLYYAQHLARTLQQQTV